MPKYWKSVIINIQAKATIKNNAKAMRIINSENNAGRWPSVHASLGKHKILSFNPSPGIHFEEYARSFLIE